MAPTPSYPDMSKLMPKMIISGNCEWSIKKTSDMIFMFQNRVVCTKENVQTIYQNSPKLPYLVSLSNWPSLFLPIFARTESHDYNCTIIYWLVSLDCVTPRDYSNCQNLACKILYIQLQNYGCPKNVPPFEKASNNGLSFYCLNNIFKF